LGDNSGRKKARQLGRFWGVPRGEKRLGKPRVGPCWRSWGMAGQAAPNLEEHSRLGRRRPGKCRNPTSCAPIFAVVRSAARSPDARNGWLQSTPSTAVLSFCTSRVRHALHGLQARRPVRHENLGITNLGRDGGPRSTRQQISSASRFRRSSLALVEALPPSSARPFVLP
jgi:hypothetical protein